MHLFLTFTRKSTNILPQPSQNIPPHPSDKKSKEIKMIHRSRTERCSTCTVSLLVPPCARSVRCTACGTVNRVGRPASLQDRPGKQSGGWMKGFFVKGNGRSLGSFSSYLLDGPPSPAPVVARPPSFPAVHGSKRALLCGVSYYGRRYELKGTVNDVSYMRFMLMERFGFPSESILMLTEDENDPSRTPTAANMRAAMRWLVKGCRSGDSLVFHFSGHGAQKLDISADEPDGYDETLCPLDYEASGMIRDDEINDTIVRPLPTGAKLHAVVDACHSGTVLDLPYVCRMNRAGFYQWDAQSRPSHVKGTSGGLAISFSGCDDHQTSADTSALTGSVATGAMTYSFIAALESEPGPTYGRVLSMMRSVIRGTDTGLRIPSPIASLIRNVLKLGLKQEPQLSSSETFDVYRKPFLL